MNKFSRLQTFKSNIKYQINHLSKQNYTKPNQLLNLQAQLLPFDELIEEINFKPLKTSTFKFNYGFSGIAKKNKPVTENISLLSYSYGEDALFCTSNALGVADGVGSWAAKNGNSAFYSRILLHHISEQLENKKENNLKKVLETGFEKTNFQAQLDKINGSTTVLLSYLNKDELQVVYVGDCSLLIIRDQKIAFFTEEQQHSFNYPYQLGNKSKDKPSDGIFCKIKVMKGDIVVLGSDGLFDNLDEEEILEEVNQMSKIVLNDGKKSLQIDPQRVSKNLMVRAKQVSDDPRSGPTPFQCKAINEGFYYQGGKPDDISVVVGIVNEA